jgi:uncharacterized protein
VTPSTATSVASPDLAEKVRFLLQPESYPTRPERIEAVETHMSWVFLGGDRVYKLKKPVVTPFLDFGSVEARRRCCAEEVRLNQRLAPGVYLRTAALSLADGALALDGAGEVVDWLVVMRRLPAARMLDAQIAAGTVEAADVRLLGCRLARFYAAAPRAPLSPEAYHQRLCEDVEKHCAALAAPRRPLGRPRDVAEVRRELLAFLRDTRDLIEERVRAGRVVDGHGDLRPEHVCLLAEPVVIDCLEFDPALRLVDPADELSFLAMECERLGASWIGPELVGAYGEVSGDTPPAELLAFHRALRATLRAKLALWHLDGERPATEPRWLELAHTYLDIATDSRKADEQAGRQSGIAERQEGMREMPGRAGLPEQR